MASLAMTKEEANQVAAEGVHCWGAGILRGSRRGSISYDHAEKRRLVYKLLLKLSVSVSVFSIIRNTFYMSNKNTR